MDCGSLSSFVQGIRGHFRCFCEPSSVFWGSGFIKEALPLAASVCISLIVLVGFWSTAHTQSGLRARIYFTHFILTPPPLTAIGSWCRALKQRQNQFTNVCAPMGGYPQGVWLIVPSFFLPLPSFLWSETQLCLTWAMRVSKWFAPHISVYLFLSSSSLHHLTAEDGADGYSKLCAF